MIKGSEKAGRFVAPLLLLASPSLLAGAAAMSLDDYEDMDRTMESVIVTATRMEESLLEVAEAVSVISDEDIKRLAPEMLAEMMRGVPGAFFQQTTPGQGIPIIRGLKGSQVLHLVDGMRLNNAFFRNAPNQYLGLVDAYATERTEIVRGSAPSLYGADAMGGVVQVLTREPAFDGLGWQAGGRLYGSYNSVDSSIIGRAEAATGHENSVISGGVTWQDHGNREAGGGESIRPSGYEVRAADLKWRQNFGGHSELMLSAQYLEQPKSPRVDELVPGFGQQTPSSEQYWFEPNRREFLHTRYRLESDAAWFSRFEAHLARQVITDDRLTQDYGETVLTEEDSESTMDGLTLQFNSPWGENGNELVWGFEYYSDSVSSSRQRTDSETGENRSSRGRYPDGSTMDSLAAYASNRWQWSRLTLDAGLRYSAFDIRLPATEEIDTVKLTPSDLTGDVHFSYELDGGVRLLANIGRGFRPPNIFDLGTLGSRPGNRFNIPNPNLEPESVWSYDLGSKMSSTHWEVEAFAWYSDYRDKISSRFTGDVTPQGRQVVQSDNLSEASLYGLESGLRYIHNDDWEIYAVVNYTRGDETEENGISTPADRVPPLNGRLGLVWRPGEKLRFEPYLDFASRQDRLSPRDAGDPRINPQGTAGFGTLNLLFSWQASARIAAGLRLQNLGDNDYREHGSGIDAPGRNIGLWLDLLL
ncbi:MAG: TonB-dependent receptor [Xanthomonadales bacterium]|jgi:outer membrane receptor protein involved in Fe transport|nr:TonB-dependent receptor [Xanthomonadales bacterium]